MLGMSANMELVTVYRAGPPAADIRILYNGDVQCALYGIDHPNMSRFFERHVGPRIGIPTMKFAQSTKIQPIPEEGEGEGEVEVREQPGDARSNGVIEDVYTTLSSHIANHDGFPDFHKARSSKDTHHKCCNYVKSVYGNARLSMYVVEAVVEKLAGMSV